MNIDSPLPPIQVVATDTNGDTHIVFGEWNDLKHRVFRADNTFGPMERATPRSISFAVREGLATGSLERFITANPDGSYTFEILPNDPKWPKVIEI